MSTNTALDQIKARIEGHTEGPWVIDGFADGDDYVRLAAFAGTNQGAVIAADIRSYGNAELIAAAPKLLAALEAVAEAVAALNASSQEVRRGDEVERGFNMALKAASVMVHTAIEEALR